VLVDAHWGQVQVYRQPIPLWPSELRSGWRTFVNTEYKTPNAQTGLSWQQTMKAGGWERIRLSAGEFTALRYTNRIVFTSSDFGRYNCVRDETLWFAPEVGRWIARVSGGTFYHNDSALPQPFNENHFRWELLSWS